MKKPNDRSKQHMRASCLTGLLATLVATSAAGADPAASDDSITIYSRMQAGAVSADLYRPSSAHQPGGRVPGYAIVKHQRSYDIDRGRGSLRVSDVAALIDPTTVTFSSLDQPDTRVLEQSFQFDLVSQSKLLQRYLGQRIAVEQPRGDFVDLAEGTLLGIGDGLTLQLDDGSVQSLRSYGSVRFPQLPGGLITRPTLEWLLESPAAGHQQTRISYETGGMTWWADYNVVLDDAAECSMDLSAWVSIVNQSGASYPDARLKLIAGDVNRATPVSLRRDVVHKMAMAEEAADFSEKAFFEYHLYTLGRRTSLPNNSTKQIQLLDTARGIRCAKELVFAPTLGNRYFGYQQLDQDYGRYGRGDISVYLRLRNETSNQLGMPLPAGRIRVNQQDSADGSLEFIGEDVIDHTPRNEEVLIKMGNAFDVVGERVQTDFRVDLRSRQLWESFEIRLRNHKDDGVSINVLENLYRAANWKIENASHRHSKESAHRISFDVEVPAGGESVLRYTAHYSW
jgi:hypothetical protein